MAQGYVDPLIAQQQGIPLSDPLLAPSLQKYALAQSLLRSGTDSSAAYPMQGIARVIETLAGLKTRGDATDAYQQAMMNRASQFGSAISGQPGAPPSAPPNSGGLFGGLFGNGSGSSSPGLIGRLFGAPSAAAAQSQDAALPQPQAGAPAIAPGQSGASALTSVPTPQAAPTVPGIGSMGITGTAAPSGAPTPVAAMQAIASRLTASGDPILMQRGNDMMLEAAQAQAKAFTDAAEKRSESGVNTDLATGVNSAAPGYSQAMAGIKGAETAATVGATKAAEAQYAGIIANEQEQARQDHARAIAANTAAGAASGTTQTMATPNGPMLMTGTQAIEYARTGVLPNGVAPAGVLPPSGAATPTPSAGQVGASDLPLPDADGAIAHANAPIPQAQAGGALLQDPKVREAQIAEIGASGKRFADAQTRLQNLGQIQTLLQNPGVITGAGGDQIQALRQAAIQGYSLIGKQPPADLVSGVASAEAIKAAANSLAIETSKDEGAGTPRISIFNAISQNKPGLESSPQGNLVRVLAMQQAAKREADFGNFAPTYYQQPGNFNKQDAEQAFAKTHPVSHYSAQIYPQSAQDFANIPVGQTWIDSQGNPHVKNAQPSPGAQ